MSAVWVCPPSPLRGPDKLIRRETLSRRRLFLSRERLRLLQRRPAFCFGLLGEREKRGNAESSNDLLSIESVDEFVIRQNFNVDRLLLHFESWWFG